MLRASLDGTMLMVERDEARSHTDGAGRRSIMRTITLEEHYATPAFMEGPGRELKAQAEAARDHPRVGAGYMKLIEALCDLDDGRIAAMAAAGIDVQVLSLTYPGDEQLDAAEAVVLAR